jgi:hypothetical protein
MLGKAPSRQINSNYTTANNKRIKFLRKSQCGSTSSGARALMGDKAFSLRTVDGSEEEYESPEKPVGVVDKSGRSGHIDVEDVRANGKSQPTSRMPPTMDWPHTVSLVKKSWSSRRGLGNSLSFQRLPIQLIATWKVMQSTTPTQ